MCGKCYACGFSPVQYLPYALVLTQCGFWPRAEVSVHGFPSLGSLYSIPCLAARTELRQEVTGMTGCNVPGSEIVAHFYSQTAVAWNFGKY